MRETGFACGAFLLLMAAIGCGSGDDRPAPTPSPSPGGASVGYVRVAGGALADVAFGVATFGDGSCVIAGRFEGTATWGAGEANETTLAAAGAEDVFVARYGADGGLVWVKRAGGLLKDQGTGVASVPDGSCVVTGFFRDVATFGPGETNATVLDDIDDDGDIFVARYSADGTLAWARRAGRNFEDRGNAIAARADGSCVITGSYNTIAVFGEGEPNATTLNAAGGSDIFVAAYESDGDLAWARGADGAGIQEVGLGIDLMPDGSSLVAGFFQGAVTFGPGDANQTTLNVAGQLDAFVARYNPDGTLEWARRAGGADLDVAYAVSAFADGSSVVGGSFEGTTAVFGPGEPNQTVLKGLYGSRDAFLARYAPDGTLAWARKAGGGGGDRIWDVAALPDGSSYVAGSYHVFALFDPGGPGETYRVSEGMVDAFVARYGSEGTPAWVRSAGSLDDDEAFGVAAHADGSCAACGGLFLPAVFSPGRPDEVHMRGPSGPWFDLFVARYSPEGSL